MTEGGVGGAAVDLPKESLELEELADPDDSASDGEEGRSLDFLLFTLLLWR